MQKWEYLVRERVGEYELNKLGEDGWELVTISFSSAGVPDTFYFKRPKQK